MEKFQNLLVVSVLLVTMVLVNYTSVYGITCHSGGQGSSSCSCSSSIASISSSCSVDCNPGYYACCDSQRTICKCFKDGTSSGSSNGFIGPVTFEEMYDEL